MFPTFSVFQLKSLPLESRTHQKRSGGGDHPMQPTCVTGLPSSTGNLAQSGSACFLLACFDRFRSAPWTAPSTTTTSWTGSRPAQPDRPLRIHSLVTRHHHRHRPFHRHRRYRLLTLDWRWTWVAAVVAETCWNAGRRSCGSARVPFMIG